jgi:hypothetical protein
MDWKDVLIVIGLLGTGGAVGSWVHEWLRGRREDRFRWHNERRAAYERFLTAIDRWRSTELEIAEYLGGLRQLTGWGSDPLFDEESMLRKAEVLDDPWAKYAVSKIRSVRANSVREAVNASLAAIEMISKPSIVEAGSTLRAQVGFLIREASEFPPRECGGWSEPLVLADANLTKARQLFVNATRQELGIDSGSLPPASARLRWLWLHLGPWFRGWSTETLSKSKGRGEGPII